MQLIFYIRNSGCPGRISKTGDEKKDSIRYSIPFRRILYSFKKGNNHEAINLDAKLRFNFNILSINFSKKSKNIMMSQLLFFIKLKIIFLQIKRVFYWSNYINLCNKFLHLHCFKLQNNHFTPILLKQIP